MKKLLIATALVALIFAGMVLFTMSGHPWELTFKPISSEEVELTVSHKGRVHGVVTCRVDNQMDKVESVRFRRRHPPVFPVGRALDWDLTTYPGRIVLLIGDEKVLIQEDRVEKQ